MRKAFISAVRAELASDKSMVVFLGDISVAGFLQPNEELVERVYNCGILEQAMVSFAAGCSAGGLYPVVQTIIPFLVERAFEQIKLDFSAQGNPGLLVGVGGGLEYSKLGYTHHTLWDTALLANLDGLLLFTPTAGAAEVATVLPTLIRKRELAYARLTDNYLRAPSAATFEARQLCALKSATTGARHALVLCGCFPGIQRLFDEANGDVFGYSFPNAIPDNIAELRAYEAIDVWEFGTVPMLTRLLRAALPGSSVTGHFQAPRFFRDYGAEAASEFVAANWVSCK